MKPFRVLCFIVAVLGLISCDNTSTTAPSNTDTGIVFWTNCPTCLPITAFVNGTKVGILSTTLPSGSTPTCDTVDALTVSEAPGTYTVTGSGATGNFNAFQVPVTSGHCSVFEYLSPGSSK